MLSAYTVLELLIILAIVCAAIVPVGHYLARVLSGERVFLERGLGWLERLIYRIAGVSLRQEMNWREYAACLLWLSFLSFAVIFFMCLTQHLLPWNPRQIPPMSYHLAFNVAASFSTNTNWQSYLPEEAVSPFVQSVGFMVQHFVAAAMVVAVAATMFRGLRRAHSDTIGNFWVDLTRSILYILLPFSVLFALLLASQGVVQVLADTVSITPLEGGETIQQLVVGPVAAFEAIKQLGGAGGGYLNANSAHPFENPTPVSNMLGILATLLLPVALTYTYGVMIGDRRQGWAVLAAMSILFLPMVWVAMIAEQMGNPLLEPLIGTAPNMEGKEWRIGAGMSGFWAGMTTAVANGSVNAAHNSLMPLTAIVCLLFMQLGELVIGGTGTGIVTMLVYVIITVFIAGLMVGRTPEFMGKKLTVMDIKMASLVVIGPSILVVLGMALAVSIPQGVAAIHESGPQGFTQALYAFNSAANNNGSGFGGLTANTPFYNIILGILILLARFVILIPVLVIAGNLASRTIVPPNSATLATHTPLFVGVLSATILLLGVLTHVPSLVLGPVLEHTMLSDGVISGDGQ